MRRIFFVLFLLFLRSTMTISEEDSMAYFRSLLQYSQSSATDIGGMVAPEIFAVSHYPSHPQPGEKVVIKAKVGSYNSMVPYKIKKVELTYWKNDKKEIQEMKLEDSEQGIYNAVLPEVKEEDEVFYTLRVEDDWGNIALEIFPDLPLQTLLEDSEDSFLKPSLDIKKIEAAYEGDRLHLCMELKDIPKRIISGEVAVYALAVLGRDVRYKPFYTEGELDAFWMAAYFPYLNIQDLVPASEIFNFSGSGGKKEKRADFLKEGNKLCFFFSPEIVREDFSVGLKIIGLTISGGIAPFAIKPMDATHVIMLYLGGHSFKVYKIP